MYIWIMLPVKKVSTESWLPDMMSRIGKSRIEIAVLLQIKEPSHLFAGRVFKCSALVNGENSRLSILRMPSSLDAGSFDWTLFAHAVFPPSPACRAGPFAPKSITKHVLGQDLSVPQFIIQIKNQRTCILILRRVFLRPDLQGIRTVSVDDGGRPLLQPAGTGSVI